MGATYPPQTRNRGSIPRPRTTGGGSLTDDEWEPGDLENALDGLTRTPFIGSVMPRSWRKPTPGERLAGVLGLFLIVCLIGGVFGLIVAEVIA